MENEKNTIPPWFTIVLILAIVGIAIYAIFIDGSNQQQNSRVSTDNKRQEGTFYMSNDLVCEITSSEDDSEGETISLLDLNTQQPKVVYESGYSNVWKKVSDTSRLLVIQFIATGSGSTDTITLYKNTGNFEREAKGTVAGNYSYSSSGQCQ